MLNLHVDLGQVIIASLIGAVGYLVKAEVSTFRKQLERHENLIIELVGDVQRLIGVTSTWDTAERRKHAR